MSIQKKAVLVRMSIAKFDPRRKNREAVEEFAEKHQVDKKMHNATDALVPPEYIERHRQLSAQGREIMDRFTLPWQDRGFRLCPIGQLNSLMDAITKLRSEWDAATNKFVQNYGYIVDEARIRLNGSFKEKHYPSQAEIKHRFDLAVDFCPVPERGHFVVDTINESFLAEMDAFEASKQDRLAIAMQELRDRFVQRLGHLAEKCATYGKDGKKSHFHETTLENLAELLDDIPKMLVSDDPVLVSAVQQAKSLISGVDADAIRASEDTRKSIATRASDLLKAFDF